MVSLISISVVARGLLRFDDCRYDQQGSTTRFTAFASTGGSSNAAFKAEDFRTIEMVKEERLGEQEDKPEYFNLRATVMFVKPVGFSYPACPGEKCSKKMAQENENEWKCEKCDKIYEAPEYRSVLSLLLLLTHVSGADAMCLDISST